MAAIDNRKDLTKEQWDQLKKLVGFFCSKEDCAAFFEIDADTLLRNVKDKYKIGWREYFDKYAGKGRVSLRRKQMELAQNGDRVMLIWMGKQHLQQSDKLEQKTHEVTAESQSALLEELKALLSK